MHRRTNTGGHYRGLCSKCFVPTITVKVTPALLNEHHYYLFQRREAQTHTIDKQQAKIRNETLGSVNDTHSSFIGPFPPEFIMHYRLRLEIQEVGGFLQDRMTDGGIEITPSPPTGQVLAPCWGGWPKSDFRPSLLLTLHPDSPS